MKIKRVKRVAAMPVFDIEMPTNNNFLLDSGVIASNCAHSASYAVVSYNTAYLKHKYPLEFWAAELSCEYENEDKLRHYADVLGPMLRGPDIFASDPKEFRIEGEFLRAPLAVLKGVGEGPVAELQEILSKPITELGLKFRPGKNKKTVYVLDTEEQDDPEGF